MGTGIAVTSAPLQQLADDLWVATRPLKIIVGDIGTRMTVIRIAQELLLHSPVALDASTQEALDRLGRVRWIVGPSKAHHLFLGDWVRAYPSAELWGAPGLAEKRTDLHFDHVLDDAIAAPWRGGLLHTLVRGMPRVNEVAFFHPSSRTLVLTDLAFNVPRGARNARLFHRLVGATGRFGPHRLVRLAIRDRAAMRASMKEVLLWDFDRVVVTHGDVLETGGKRQMQHAFAFLG
jgi:hypothetical protein